MASKISDSSLGGGNLDVPSDDAQLPLRYEVVGSIDEGLNLNLQHNLFQAFVILLSASVGAIVGCTALAETPFLGLICGALLGMLGGAFVSGLLLLLFSRRPRQVTFDQYIQLGEKAHRRARWAIAAFIANGTAGVFIFPLLGHHDAPWAFVVCILWAMAWVGLCTYAKLSAGRGLWLKCPNCGKAVQFAPCGPRNCQHCTFVFS